MKRCVQVFLVLAMVMMWGCGADVSGPKELVAEVNKAYEAGGFDENGNLTPDGNLNKFLRLHHTDHKKEVELVREGFRFAIAWKKTEAVIDEVYGKGVWENEFISKEGERDVEKGIKPDYNFMGIPGLGKMWTYGLDVKMVGDDGAIVTRETHKGGLRLVKIDDKWFVDSRLGAKGKEAGYIDTQIVFTQAYAAELGWLRGQARVPGKTWEEFQLSLGQVLPRTMTRVKKRAEEQ